ncbi:hypothetical protein C0993_010454 [Termitomyces sp. T159_Od127]|nr:hypothetical protein C0993_010454 [Termitomyces sp. T159_Od127]
METVEEYLQSAEEYFFSSLSAATTDFITIHDAVNRLWLDISRYGPPIPALPALGDFQLPPPPPPPTPQLQPSLFEASAHCASKHPWIIGSLAVGILGTGLLAGYTTVRIRRRNHHRVKLQSNDRRQVVVVLGGDTPLALPLILDLEAKGFIVIASVSTPEAGSLLEQQSHGYVRALVLDPNEASLTPATISVFLRSLASTLSRRFPLSSSGDPFASPASHPYIQSVICLLTLPTPTPSIHAPLEHISLRNTYLPFLSATHITPLQVLQAMMPLLRTGPARARDKGKKSIIVCLPAIDARVGLPFASMQAMSAAGTLRGVEVLRREINLASLTDQTESMKNIKIVVADVGLLDVGIYSSVPPQDNIYKPMEDWSPSEKLAYGPAFASISHTARPVPSRWDAFKAIFKNKGLYGVPRTPTNTKVFVENIVSVVTGGRHNPYFFGLGRIIGQARNWLRGERFSIGAGATTYKFASYLPSSILDTLLNVPAFLISVRNCLLPAEPFVRPPADLPPPAQPTNAAALDIDDENHDQSEANSEADVESNASDGVSSSWVSVQEN